MSSLPVVAVSVSRRGYALVCLSPRLTASRVIHRTPRRSTADAAKLRAMLAELLDIITATDAQTLVLEAEEGRQPTAGLLRGVAEWAEARGIRVVFWPRKAACTEVCGQPVLVDAVRRIVFRFPVLRDRLLNQGGKMTRDSERWRHLRPLLVAFVLAHGFAARSVITTFGGSIPPHPPPT